ncbi:putative dsRNA-binding protein [Streptomyces mirabilis]|uniref:putative dsRNA-binding protein n=1 Tax=Streptomyces mirabilis TaxID=68239 RepID=UPI00332E65C1
MNHWVGIVALRDAPSSVSTPLHRMATAIETARRIRTYSLGTGRKVLHADLRDALRAVGRRYSLANDSARAAASFRAVRFFPDYTDAWRDLPWWLQQELARELEASLPVQRSAVTVQARRPPRQQPITGKPQRRAGSVASTTCVVERVGLEPMDVVRPLLTDPGAPFDVIDLGAVLEADLASAGLSVADDPAHARWLRIATLHASYVYEDVHGPAGLLTLHTLNMLGSLGGAWLDLLVLDALAGDPKVQDKDEGTQSARLAHHRKEAVRQLGAWAAAAGFAHLGRGQAQSETASVAETLALQVVGALVLIGADEPARRLVAAKTRDVGRGSGAGVPQRDWITLVQERPYVRGMRWSYDTEGPDHDRTFSATLHVDDGRTASATGGSKKAARQAAAHAFLIRYEPAAAFAVPAPRRAPAPVGPSCYGVDEPGHGKAIRDLRQGFGLAGTAEPWLAQALTHKSWAYENPGLVEGAHQRSNSLLAHAGSHVARALMAYERAHEAASRGLRPAPEEARIGSVGNAECGRLGEELRLTPAMLIGTGERRNRRSDPGEGAAQAVLAVAWRQLGARLLTRRPYVLHTWLTTLDQGLDPATQLQNVCSRFGIRLHEPEFYVRGEEHAEERYCELVLTCGEENIRWAGTPVMGGKTTAKQRAAQEILALLHAHASGSTGTWSAEETRLLRGVLRQQLYQAPHLPPKERLNCARDGVLGLDLLASTDPEGFRAWAHRTQTLVGDLPQDTLDDLTRFYTQCLTQVRYNDDSSLRTALRSVAAGAADVSTRLAAAAALRAATAEHPADLRGLLAAWWAQTAETVLVRLSDGTGQRGVLALTAVEAGALREVLGWAAEAARAVNRPMSVELTIDTDRLYVLVGIDGVNVPKTCARLLLLLDEIVPSMRCTVTEDSLLFHWRQLDGSSDLDETALAVAGLTALSEPLPVPADLKRQARDASPSRLDQRLPRRDGPDPQSP